MVQGQAPFLGVVSLFTDLSVAEQQEMSWLVSPFERQAGESLFRQGDPGDALYWLEHGRVALTVRTPGGNEVPLSEIGPGQMLGEMALLDSGPRSATARAIESTTGYSLSALGFNVLCAALRPSGFKVLRRLCTIMSRRLRSLAEGFEGGDVVRIGGWLEEVPSASPGAAIPGLRFSVEGLDQDNLLLLPTFRRFSRMELDEFVENAHAVAAPRGQVVFRQGDPPGSCFVVIRGAVLVCVERGGELRKLAVEGPGAVFGHYALLDTEPRSATCIARENCLLLEIEAATFNALFESASAVAFKFFAGVAGLLSGDLRRANQRIGLRSPRFL